jgi:hypothetical protein
LKIKHNPFAKAFLNTKPMITIENDRVITTEHKPKLQVHPKPQPPKAQHAAPTQPANRNDFLLQNWYAQYYPLHHQAQASQQQQQQQYSIQHYQSLFNTQLKQEPTIPHQHQPSFNYYEAQQFNNQNHQPTYPAPYFYRAQHEPSSYNTQFMNYNNYETSGYDDSVYPINLMKRSANQEEDQNHRSSKKQFGHQSPNRGMSNTPVLYDNAQDQANNTSDSDENFNLNGHSSANNSSNASSSSSFALSTTSSL